MPAVQENGQNSESNLLLGLERILQDSFAAYLLPSLGSSQLTAVFSLAAGSPIAVSKTSSGSAPQVTTLVINNGMTSKLPGDPGPVLEIGSQYLAAHNTFRVGVACGRLKTNCCCSNYIQFCCSRLCPYNKRFDKPFINEYSSSPFFPEV